MPFRLFALIAAVLFAMAHAWHLELDPAQHRAIGLHLIQNAGLPTPDRSAD